MKYLEFFKHGSHSLATGLKLVHGLSSDSLDSIYRCVSCPRSKKFGPPLKPLGPKNAKLMVVGACPGRQEVKYDVPFYPQAPGGSLLNNYLKVINVSRESCYLTNACFCLELDRFQKDVLPTPDEEQICAAWKIMEFDQYKNIKYVLLLGKNAIRQFLGSSYLSPTKTLGFVEFVEVPRPLLIFICHHPGYILRRPKEWVNVKRALQGFSYIISKDFNKLIQYLKKNQINCFKPGSKS